MKKTFRYYFAIWAVLFVLFNIIAFVSVGWINQEKYTPSFWVGYIFITLSFIGQLICARTAFNAKSLQKLFYNIPLISLSWTGLVVSFVIGGLCMLISPLPYWVGVIVCSITLAIVAIAVIRASIAVNAVADIDNKIKAQTFFIKSLTVDAESLIARAQSEEIKSECKKVYEVVRYSDPMSNDMLAGIEGQITIKTAELANAVNDNNLDMVKNLAQEVVVLVEDRNKRCRLLK